MRLNDPSGISELIASTVGLAEEAVTMGSLAKDLKQAGAPKKITKSVTAALADLEDTGLAAF